MVCDREHELSESIAGEAACVSRLGNTQADRDAVKDEHCTRIAPNPRPTPDLHLNLSGIFWTEIAKIHSRTKPSDQVLIWDNVDEFPSEGESIQYRRPSTGPPSWSGPYKEIMAAIKLVSDLDDAKQTVLDIIRLEQAHLRNFIEQMHLTNTALQWICMNPANGALQLAQLVDVNRWLKCERSQVRIKIQKLKSDAEQSAVLPSTPTEQHLDAGAPDSRSNCSTPTILRYDVVKINRVNRNSRRVIEINIRQHSLAIVRPECVLTASPCESVHSDSSRSTRTPSLFSSQRDLFSFCDDSDNILLSNSMITDVRLFPASPRRTSTTSTRSEIHIEYLTNSMRKSKIFRGLMVNVSERDQLYKHICLYVLQKPNLLIASSPQVSSTLKSTRPIGTIRASGTIRAGGPSRRAFSATFDARLLSRSLVSDSQRISLSEVSPILPIHRIAERAHSNWALDKLCKKWTMGKHINLKSKVHTELVPFNELSLEVQQFKVESVRKSIDSICNFGYTIQSSENERMDGNNILERSDKEQLLSVLAVTLHETWIDVAVNSGWRFGSRFDEDAKQHPNLTPFSCLCAFESSEYTLKAQFIIDAIAELGMFILYSHRHARASSRVQSM